MDSLEVKHISFDDMSIPSHWKYVGVGDLVTRLVGGCSTKKTDYFSEGVLVLNKGHIKTSGKVDLGDNKRYVTKKYAQNNSDKIIRNGSVLVTLRDFSVKADFLGLMARYRGTEDALITQGMCFLEINDFVIPNYLVYYSNAPFYRNYVKKNKVGSTQVHLRNGQFLNTKIPLPPIDEQKCIVAEIEKQFSRLDEAVANLKRIRVNLKRYKAAVLKAAVEGKLTESWRKAHPDTEPASKLLERILTARQDKWSGKGKFNKPESFSLNELPSVPESWCYCSADTICTELFLGLTSKVDYVEDGGVPLVRARDISGGHLSFTEARCISQRQHQKLTKYRKAKKGDVLVSKSGSLGTCAIVEVDREFSIYESIICMRTFGEFLLPTFLLWMLRSQSIQVRMLGKKVGSTVGHLNLISFRKLVIPIPPVTEQHQIVAEVERRLSVIDELEATVETNLARADRLRQSILQQSFSGKLI